MIPCLFVEHIYSFNWCKMEIKLDEKGEQYYNGRQYEFNSGDKIKNARQRGQLVSREDNMNLNYLKRGCLNYLKRG